MPNAFYKPVYFKTSSVKSEFKVKTSHLFVCLRLPTASPKHEQNRKHEHPLQKLVDASESSPYVPLEYCENY